MQDELKSGGHSLWHDLIEVLEPDLVLMSVAKRYRAAIRFPEAEAVSVVYTVPGQRRWPHKPRSARSLMTRNENIGSCLAGVLLSKGTTNVAPSIALP